MVPKHGPSSTVTMPGWFVYKKKTKTKTEENVDFQTPVNSNLVVFPGLRIRESLLFKANFGDNARFGNPWKVPAKARGLVLTRFLY